MRQTLTNVGPQISLSADDADVEVTADQLVARWDLSKLVESFGDEAQFTFSGMRKFVDAADG